MANAIPQAPSLYGPDPAVIPKLLLYRGRPAKVQSLDFRAGSLEATLFWNAPADMTGVDHWHIFKDNENNLIGHVADRSMRQTTVKIPSSAKVWFYVCAVTKFGMEGPKVGVLANSNTDQVVVSGTGGGTSGSSAAPDPGWSNQHSGGKYLF